MRRYEPPQINSPEESQFQMAIAHPGLKDVPREPFVNCLKTIIVKLGVRAHNWPIPEEWEVLLNFVKENYSTHTLPEIKLAFEMAITGKLNDPEGKVLSGNCFENFSCVFFSSVMNAYRKWASQVYGTIPAKPEEKKPDIPVINLLYAGYLQNKINKLPCRKFSRLISIKK